MKLTHKVKQLSFTEKMDAIEYKIRLCATKGNRCEYCGELLPSDKLQLAHIVPRHKNFIEKYSYEAINHRFNFKVTCSLCNSKAMNEVAKSDYARTEHFKPIIEDLKSQGYNTSTIKL